MIIIVLGAVLLLVGLLLGTSLLITAGIVILIIGAVLMLAENRGYSVRSLGGRRSYTNSRPRRRRSRRARYSW